MSLLWILVFSDDIGEASRYALLELGEEQYTATIPAHRHECIQYSKLNININFGLAHFDSGFASPNLPLARSDFVTLNSWLHDYHLQP